MKYFLINLILQFDLYRNRYLCYKYILRTVPTLTSNSNIIQNRLKLVGKKMKYIIIR